jgi:hypothetical protein
MAPATGDTLIHLLGRPLMAAPRQTPASGEGGVRIGLVGEARYEVQKRTSGRNLEVVRVRFRVRRGTLVPIPP